MDYARYQIKTKMSRKEILTTYNELERKIYIYSAGLKELTARVGEQRTTIQIGVSEERYTNYELARWANELLKEIESHG